MSHGRFLEVWNNECFVGKDHLESQFQGHGYGGIEISETWHVQTTVQIMFWQVCVTLSVSQLNSMQCESTGVWEKAPCTKASKGRLSNQKLTGRAESWIMNFFTSFFNNLCAILYYCFIREKDRDRWERCSERKSDSNWQAIGSHKGRQRWSIADYKAVQGCYGIFQKSECARGLKCVEFAIRLNPWQIRI